MRSGRGLVASLLSMVLLAGCMTPSEPEAAAADPGVGALEPLTEATLAFGQFLALKVPAEDGVELHVDLQLPEGDGPFPVLLEYTPYSALGDQTWGATTERGLSGLGLAGNGLADRYVPRGYAVGVAHVRGTGESGGCLSIGGEQEGKDGYAIVEHLAAQPWSNGRVALMGTSYVGTTPIETAILNPPHLTTIIPVSAVTDWYRYYFENGEQRMNGDPPPGASYPDPALWMALGVAPGPRTLAADPMDAVCVAEYTQNYWLQDDRNAFWQARDHGALAGQINASVLYAHGWGDENVASNMITEWWHLVNATKRAWFQQHGHGVPGSKEAYYEYEHRWLDHWMLGRQNGALDLGPVVVEDNLGTWRAEEAWPPADTTPLRFALDAEGRLVAGEAADGTLAFRDDGVGEMREDLRGVTWQEFVSDPLANATLVAGEPTIHLELSSDMTDTQVSVLVFDRADDGTQAFLTRGYLDARHRDSLETGKDLTPGERVALEWRLHPRDHVVAAGHRLVVVVKASDPYIIPDATRATNTLHFGPAGSWIELPVVDAAGRTFSDAPPTPVAWDVDG